MANPGERASYVTTTGQPNIIRAPRPGKKTKQVKLPPPTPQYLLSLRTELRTRYEAQDFQIDRIRQNRSLTRPIPIDDRYKLVNVEVRDPAIADEIQRVVAMLSINRPKLHVTPEKGENAGDAAQENATLREQWTEQILKAAGQYMAGVDTFQQLCDAVVGDGGGWTKLMFDADIWEERYSIRLKDQTDDLDDDGNVTQSAAKKFDRKTEEAKKRSGQPFVWQCVDVRQIYPLWTSRGLEEVLEVQERPLYATLRQYRLSLDSQGNITDIPPDILGQGMSMPEVAASTNYSTLQFLAHADNVYITYMLAGTNTAGEATTRIVAQWEHGYGRVPYFYAPGIYPVGAWMHNRKVGWSISDSKRWLVEYRAFLRTILAQLAARDSLAPLKLTRAPGSLPANTLIGDEERPKDPETWDLRQIIPLQPGEDLVPLGFPGVAEALKEELAEVTKAIEELMSPRVPDQIGGGLEGAGFAINTLLTEGRVRHDPLSQSIERSLEEITRFAWWLVRNKVKETVWVRQGGKGGGWLGAGPEDLTDDVGVEWELDYAQPSAELIKQRAIHERIAAKTLNLDEGITRLGDNPDEVRQGIAIDAMRQAPWYQQLLQLHVLQKLGRGDLLNQANLASQLAQNGQPNLPLGMGNELVPDLGNLAQSPNGVGAAAQAMVAHGQGGPPQPQAGQMPQNGSAPGVGSGAIVPQQAAAAGIQRIPG